MTGGLCTPAGRVYVRQPWADLLVSGRKRVETAHMRLPDRFLLQWLEVQTEDRQAVGMVLFSSWIKWHTADAFDAAYRRHLVTPDSPYHWTNRSRTFGWGVLLAHRYAKPKPMPAMKSQFRLELYHD